MSGWSEVPVASTGVVYGRIRCGCFPLVITVSAPQVRLSGREEDAVILTGGGLRKQLESDDNDLLREVGAEAYLRGVSPRRVEGLVEALGIASLSKSQVSELAAGL